MHGVFVCFFLTTQLLPFLDCSLDWELVFNYSVSLVLVHP